MPHDRELLHEALSRVLSRRRSRTLRELKEVAALKGKDFSLSDLIINDRTLYQLYSQIYEDGGVSDLETTIYNSLEANDDLFKQKVLEALEIDASLLSKDEY
jgi:hypothetical protein